MKNKKRNNLRTKRCFMVYQVNKRVVIIIRFIMETEDNLKRRMFQGTLCDKVYGMMWGEKYEEQKKKQFENKEMFYGLPG